MAVIDATALPVVEFNLQPQTIGAETYRNPFSGVATTIYRGHGSWRGTVIIGRIHDPDKGQSPELVEHVITALADRSNSAWLKFYRAAAELPSGASTVTPLATQPPGAIGLRYQLAGAITKADVDKWLPGAYLRAADRIFQIKARNSTALTVDLWPTLPLPAATPLAAADRIHVWAPSDLPLTRRLAHSWGRTALQWEEVV